MRWADDKMASLLRRCSHTEFHFDVLTACARIFVTEPLYCAVCSVGTTTTLHSIANQARLLRPLLELRLLLSNTHK